jgi:nitrate/nitrite-specific signal transduction histidine kinase
MLTVRPTNNGLAGRQVHLVIDDNGCGFDTTISKPTHIGLDIMRERAAAIGAQLEIRSAIGAGTTVRVEATVGDASSLSYNNDGYEQRNEWR